MERALLPPLVVIVVNGAGSCPAPGSGPSGAPDPTPGPARPGSLANVPTADRGVYAAGALSICGIAMKSCAWYIGFICAGAVLVEVRMAYGRCSS